jgi:hypothetical protein
MVYIRIISIEIVEGNSIRFVCPFSKYYRIDIRGRLNTARLCIATY